MSCYDVAQAEASFAELVQRALAGEEVVITRDNKPLLRLVRFATTGAKRRPGSAKGLVTYIAPDFDATPEEFADNR